MKYPNVLRAGLVFGGVAALTLSGALSASATTYDITQNHTDIISIDGIGTPGSIFDQLPTPWVPWSSSDDYRIVFNVDAYEAANPTAPALCAGGVYTIPNSWSIESTLPFVGLDNDTSDVYEITMSKVSGSGDVQFLDGTTPELNTAGSLVHDLDAHKHEHFTLKFNGGVCGAGGEQVYKLKFKAQKEGSPSFAERTFDFVIQDN